MFKLSKKLYLFFIIFLLLIAIIVIIKPYYDLITKDLKISVLKTLLSFNSIEKYNNQINILLLGIPGKNHDGPNLSDSIIVVNYNFKINRVATISIPRDIWSSTLKDKINSAYAYGEAKQINGGLKLAKAEIEVVIGQPIQYAILIDFNKFKELIDYLGGIDVNIEKSFIDKKFPIPGKEDDQCNGDPEYKCRYQAVIFNKGLTHLDGEASLKFVRSRHAEGEEGSDFSRGKRQQQVIAAVINKIVKLIKTFNIDKIKKLYLRINNSITRDISNQQIAIIVKNPFFREKLSQKNLSLSDDLFEVPNYTDYEGKYVLIPKNSDLTKIHKKIEYMLQNNN